MTLKGFLLSSSPEKLIISHIILGGLCLISKIFIIGWTLWCLQQLLAHRNTDKVSKITFIAYIVGLEIVCRMARTAPFIPYEFGKYVLIIGPLILSNTRIEYLLNLTLLVPGIILGLFAGLSFPLFNFNIFGWLAFFIFTMMTARTRFNTDQLNRLLLSLLLGSTSALFFAFFRSPEISEIQFSLDANSTASGGFAPNQVSTSFGLGLGILGLFILLKIKLIKPWVQVSLVLFFLFRGILTFSRGGISVGLLAILVVFILDILIHRKNIARKFFLLILLGSATTIAVFQINRISNGMFFKRLSGETIGTHYGIVEKDLNTLSSGRVNIFKEDLELFKKNIILGTGVHQSTLIRSKQHPFGLVIASHVELSRLMAEHGILGVLFMISVLFLFIRSFITQETYLGKYFVAFCFVFSIGTTFHSATRTFITPLMGGLAMIHIIPVKKSFTIENSTEFKL